MSTKEREINPSKRKAKKSKSSGRNANKTSHSDENQALAKEKNVLLRQIDFLNSIILDTKLKEPNKSLLTTFWIFFRCGQLIFRMADCEVEGAIASSLSIPPERAMSPTGERSDEGRNIRTKQNPLGPQERQTRTSAEHSSSCASASSSNTRELDEQILEVKINPKGKNTVLDTSTNKDTLSKEKESENEKEETKLITNDFAHYVGTSIDAELREQILKLGHTNQKVISKKMPREGAFHHLIVSYPRQDKRSKGNGCVIQHDFMLLTVSTPDVVAGPRDPTHKNAPPPL
ncbi:hypothetical protein TNCV_3109481 [Trichonephila clavipes]|nr:hypothetical protein TNCV_3109481 [Trichonephila clavipes]